MPVDVLPSSALPFPALGATLGTLRTHLKAHYGRLGRASRRMRFMAEPSQAALDRIADRASPDLLIEIEQDGGVRGVLEAYDLGGGHAEVALSVEDAYQGHGLGRRLFEEGLRLLGRRGFATADLCCLRDNGAVLHLVREAGGRVTLRDGEAVARIELGSGG